MNPSKEQSKGVRPEFVVDHVIENPLPKHGTNIGFGKVTYHLY